MWSSNPIPGHISRKRKTLIQKDASTSVFTAALFITTTTWKQTICNAHTHTHTHTMEYSDQISRSVVSDSLRPHESQHARPPCPSPTPGVHWDSRPSSQWCHPAISSSLVPFSSCPQSLPASESFPMSQLFTWGGQSTGVSDLASFLPKKSQGWSPSKWTGWISLQSKGLSRVFSNTTVQMEYYSASKHNEIMLFVAIWMDLEMITLSEVSEVRQRQISWYHLYVEFKKIIHMKLLIYKTETDLQIQKTIWWLPKREGGINWEYGINRYTLLYIKWGLPWWLRG